MTRLGVTPSQTVGPFFTLGLIWDDGPDAVQAGTPGAIRIAGTVYDGAGEPVPDAVIETWQADAAGRFDCDADPRGAVHTAAFRGLGRCGTDDDGHYEIHTVKPGPVPAPDGTLEAPHIDVTVLARGLLARLVTRIYFDDEQAANASDPVLAALPEAAAARAHTVVAAAERDGYRFDIHLQGANETLFFAL
jgi:protocatechuate 3,4-dioxygenase alpha subunit